MTTDLANWADLTPPVLSMFGCGCMGCRASAATISGAGRTEHTIQASAAPAPTIVRDFTALISGPSVSGVAGKAAFYSYSFPAVVPDFYRGYWSDAALATFRQLTEAERNAARQAIELFANVTGITFFEVGPGKGDMNFSAIDMALLDPDRNGTVFAGAAFSPEYFDRSIGVYSNPLSSEIYLGYDYAASRPVLIHEIGHALGLKHPFQGDIRLASDLDDVSNTVMSYTFAGFPGDVLGPLDIAALQYLYGDNSKDGTAAAVWNWNAAAQALTQSGTSADEVLSGIGGVDIISGGGGADILSGRDGDDMLDGGDGNDTLNGGNGSDSLLGGNDNDIFYSEAGDDTADGGAGNDTIYGYTGNDCLSGGLGHDSLTGWEGNDTFDGGDGADTVFAGPGNDRVNGGNGNDELQGQEDDDTLNGGDGNDSIYAWTGNDTANGGEGDDYLSGFEGDDVLNGDGGADEINGDSGADVINGGDGDDRVWAGTGSDILNGGIGNDELQGQEDHDTLNGGDGNDSLFAWTGNDIASGGDGDDYLSGYDGDDTLNGNGGADQINGDGGRDVISGGDGNDSVWAGLGNDVVNGGGGNDQLQGLEDDDILSGGDGNDSLFAGTGNDSAEGGEGHDYLSGGDDNDTLSGDGGADTIYGDNGNDVIDGGGGKDLLYGGSGADRFVFTSIAESPRTLFDQVEDFQSGIDKIVLSALALSNLQIAPFSGGGFLLTGMGSTGEFGVFVRTSIVLSDVIVNNASSLVIAATAADQTEGNSGSKAFTFTVTRSGNTAGVSTATWAVTGSGVNAANAADFAGAVLPSGTVDFTAGETSKIITVNVNGDSAVEPDDGFTVTLSSPTAGTSLGTATAIGVIFNDDSTLAIAAASADQTEGNSGSKAFTFTVTRGGSTAGASTANWAVTGSGANAADATDFAGSVLPFGTVNFAAGETSKVITANVSGDSAFEPEEGFTVTLSGASAGTVFTAATASGLIRNDDPALITGTAGNDSVVGTSGNDRILGLGGDDTIRGGVGDDWIDGGDGIDSAVFSQALAGSSVVRHAGNRLAIASVDGTDQVVNTEFLRFADGVVHLEDGLPLVDDLFYSQRYADVLHAGVDPDAHYSSSGWREGRDPNGFFSTSGYLAANGDVKAANIDPLAHYASSGWREGRDPSAQFDTRLYLARNPDVAAARINPLQHYLEYGQFEGRSAYAAIGDRVQPDGFDGSFYLMINRDVAAAGMDPYQHFKLYGWREGRNPNAWFDVKGYLNAYPDVAAAGINPLEHYHQNGWKERRDPSAGFDTSDYLSVYTDVAAAGIDPLVHYLQAGAYEGRSSFTDNIFG